MNHRFFVGALILTALLATPAAAAAPLQPTSKWVVDFAPSQCTAVRDYGTTDKPLALVFKPSVVGDVMTLAIIRGGAQSDIVQNDVVLKLDQGPPLQASLLAFTAKERKRRVEMINLPLETSSALRRSSSLSIAGSGIASRTFALQGMVPLMKTMATCLADLQRVWNVDEAAKARLKQPPRSTKPLVANFNSDDYPRVAVRSDQSGIVEFALLVDEGGKVADCTVIKTSGVATLDSQSCAIIMARAAFHPAIGADDKPAKAAVIQRIRWELP